MGHVTEDRYVFGIAVDPLGDRAYAFVRVDAILEERRLRTDFDSLEEFPTEGNIFVDEDHLPDTDNGAIWRVRRGPSRSSTRHAEWSALGRSKPGPLEVISIPISSGHLNGVRQQLLEGVELGYVPASQVLVQLLDGLIIGPIRASGNSDAFDGFRSSSEALAEPIRAWPAARLGSFQVDAHYALDRRRRTFVSDLDLPAGERWVDLAEFRDSVRIVLKPLAGGEGRTLTAAQLREVAGALRDDDYPQNLRERVHRVRRAVQSLSMATEELEALMPAVLANAEVIKGIEVVRQHAADEERKRIASEKQAMLDEVRRLREQEQQLRDRISHLSNEAATAEKLVKEAADAAVEQVRAQVQQAMDDAGQILADVAILRPFIEARVSPTSERDQRQDVASVLVNPARVPEGVNEAVNDEPATAADFVTRLAGDLKVGGISPNTARLLAREVVAALLAGQVPVLTGSVANWLADVLSRALAGRRVMIAEIPVGLVSDAPLRDAVDAATRAADRLLPVLVLRGFDRSAVEMYGGLLLETVSQRVLVGDYGELPLAFLASAVGGPACLPIGPGVFDLGPVIDTDLLSFSRKGGGQVPLRRAVSLEKWLAWRAELGAGVQEVQEGTRAVCVELSIAPSILWRRGTESAAGFLSALSREAKAEAADSVLARWVVPRALSEGLDPDDIFARLKGLGFDESTLQGRDGADGRVGALIQKARRILKARA